MKSIAVVYSTKSGHTKKYADWLKEDVDADVISVDSFNVTKMLAYKLIIFACGVYGDKLAIMDFIKKNLTSVPAQKIMVMAVSWYTNDSPEATQKLINENFPEQFKNTVPLFVINSGIDKKTINAMDKAKLLAAQNAINRKDGRSSDDINALAIIKGFADQTSKDNLASIKNAIDEFFNPKKKEPEIPVPAPKPAAPVPPKPAAPAAPKPAEPAAAKPAEPAAPKPAAAVQPKTESPAPAPEKPKPVTDTNDLNSSVEEAFKNLGAIRQARPENPVVELSKEEEQTSDEPVVRFNSSGQVVVSSVLEAINSLNSTPAPNVPKYTVNPEAVGETPAVQKANPAPAAPKPAAPKQETAAPKPTAPVPPKPAVAPKPTSAAAETPVVQKANPAPAAPKPAAPKPEAVQAAPKSTAAPKPTPTAAEIPVVQKANPAPAAPKPAVQEAKPTVPETPEQETYKPDFISTAEPAAKHKNSYMELFASRRRLQNAGSAAEETETPVSAPTPQPVPEPVVAPEPAAAVVPEKPIEKPAPARPEPVSFEEADNSFIDFDLGISEPEPAPAVSAPIQQDPTAAAEIDLDGYDFIEDVKPSASKRAMNAVQELAKAKAAAEQEAAKKAAEQAAPEAARRGEEEADVSEYQESAPAYEETPAPVHRSEELSSDLEKMKHEMEMLAEESEFGNTSESGSMYEETPSEPIGDGLDAFAFADTADYYASEPAAPVPEETDSSESESNPDLDLKKLQEQINASIENNRAAHKKMQAKYGKRQKEVVNNPFAVQFDEEDEKKPKKNKNPEIGQKRLDDPIDPDIFFSRPGKNKEFDMLSDSMPEIKPPKI